MASNSELSEMKLLLQSLAPGLKAAKSDVAELKKSQSQSQQSNSTCANAQTPALIRDTETAVLQLVEEEKVLIHAEVVQLSRTVKSALEDAKGKMMEKVAEVVDANDPKRSRSTADLDGDDDEDVPRKRVKQEEESDKDSDNDHSDNDDKWEKQRWNCTALDRAVMDISNTAYESIDCEEVLPE
ncbi:hypothetical protein B0T09DRAFT_387670 [Sordaria sp. MPI-SDFR-AT-0083]|nr:hypothetical protein B0T09DRAFT_387670 [Sordaria sp. MPI-SDFR-AT-0083]